MSKQKLWVRRKRRTRLESLSPAERAALLRFNDTLAALEQIILAEGMPIDRRLRLRDDDPSDPLTDYELEAVVSYVLKKEDRHFRKGESNLLARRDYYLKGISRDVGESGLHCERLADGINHNDFAVWDHPQRGEFHCWMYHDLYDHSYGPEAEYQELDWADILRIGEVSWRLQVTQQYCPNWDHDRYFWRDLPRDFSNLPPFGTR